MKTPDSFWHWFAANSERLTAIGELEDDDRNALQQEIQHQLDAYCEGLSFEIGPATTNGRTFTISAEGDTDLFRYVIDLVDSAPDLDWWEFLAFKPRLGTELKVTFDKYLFDTRKMYFQQLECVEEPELLGLRVAIPHNRPNDEDFQVGVYVTIEALLGEFDCATLVGYMETVEAPAEPFKNGFRPLDDLPKFADWFKQSRDE